MLVHNGNIITHNSKWFGSWYSPIPVPLGCVRVRTSDGLPPTVPSGVQTSTSFESATLVEGTTDVYDVYKSGTNFNYLCLYCTNITEIIDSNIPHVTSMRSAFSSCRSLTYVDVKKFDTSRIIDMWGLFRACGALTSIPMIKTDNAQDVQFMFEYCYNVETGILDMYNQLTTQAAPPPLYQGCFAYCGTWTESGTAENNQLPAIWRT